LSGGGHLLQTSSSFGSLTHQVLDIVLFQTTWIAMLIQDNDAPTWLVSLRLHSLHGVLTLSVHELDFYFPWDFILILASGYDDTHRTGSLCIVHRAAFVHM
jgi:hypothetical protein